LPLGYLLCNLVVFDCELEQLANVTEVLSYLTEKV
jgi:hypothetical protein